MINKLCVIKRGKHYSNGWWIPSFYFRTKINFTITFENEFWYDVPKKYRKDTNKIFGISDSIHHHRHSIRLGFRKIEDIIEFRVYYYIDGEHYSDLCYLTKIEDLKKSYNGSIEIKKKTYIFKFANTTTLIGRKSWWFGPRYLLFPYLGDKTKVGTAPKKDVKIRIKAGYEDMIKISL